MYDKKGDKGTSVESKLTQEFIGSESRRIWEIDFFRGIALLLMIYFHVIFDMKEIFDYHVSYSTGINYYTGKTSAILFIFLSGISSSMSRSNVKRGLKVLAVAMVITIATHLYGNGLGIKFGILHFLGTCMILAPLFQRVDKYLLIFLGGIFIWVGNSFAGVTLSHDYLMVFGLTSTSFISSDYYPLLPWMGVFLFGMAAAQILYRERRSLFPFVIPKNPISWAGRHTLIFYVIHQPVIMAVLTLLTNGK